MVSLHTGCRREGERKSWAWLLFPLVLICKHHGSLSPQGLVQFFWEWLLVEWLCIKHVTSPLSSACRALPDWLHCGYFPAVWEKSGTLFHPLRPRGWDWRGQRGKAAPRGRMAGGRTAIGMSPALAFCFTLFKCFPENSAVKFSLNQTKFSHWCTLWRPFFPLVESDWLQDYT